MILEYMLIREVGKMVAPSWVEDGGYFYNPADFTLIGWSPDEGQREYYIPDTVHVLTRQALIDRQLGIHAVAPTIKPTGETMTNEEVADSINLWCDSRGEP